MLYTEDQIKKYLGILGDYSINSSDESNLKAKCSNCENSTSFTIDYGYKICDECGVANGHVLGFYDIKIVIDYIIEKRVYISISITMRKRLIKFLKE